MPRGFPVMVGGPLAELAEVFRAELGRRGYVQPGPQMALLGDLSEWMASRDVAIDRLDWSVLDQFWAERQEQGAPLRTWRSAAVLLDVLARAGQVVAGPKPLAPVDVLMARYRIVLFGQRGLAAGTVAGYERVARLFCQDVGVERLGALTAAEVDRFVTSFCVRPRLVSPRELVADLRSFLRFLHVEGVIAGPLAEGVPRFATRRAASLPRPLTSAEVGRLLGACDRRRGVGRRDYAVLVVLSRLGLRAGEVAGLCLGDIAWRSGELSVLGKGGRRELLPLPDDVGAAIADYLRRGRPRVECRAVFVRQNAPLGPLSAGGVTWIVYRACEQAGLPRVGAHRLRHSAASAVLAGGGTLVEVNQLLRHSRLDTTSSYAKVDHAALAGLARPWPGVAR